ncbi:RluA family pseudouridine synthase [Paenibacillus xerothermodurans]|uniref:Pseudouridine synthase n=1 Tax=Paenibacillus xerothermodurans TaxID=1977292 RepID=A0A2W1NSQ5_PAEXE|nr:RluA family pseudouridine synthase [Paenibacillus xerothermodurans]PZE20786.1 RluA family pseudouridine synthase [Paenibacillus xerothermodurans]
MNKPKKHSGKSTNTAKKPRTSRHGGQSPAQPKLYTVKEPGELLPFLLSTLSNMGRNSVKSLLSRGQVSVNDKAVTVHNFPLEPGHIVAIHRERAVAEAPLLGMAILHEDDDIIVIKKESGLLSIASARPEEHEVTAYRQLMTHVRRTNPHARIFVVHRLDRDTSGVMMFAKSERIQQALQNSWQDAVKERSYIALVDGKVQKPAGTVTSWLKESRTLKMYSGRYPNDGQLAVTHYKVLQSNSAFSLLEVHLETGRKNQIRVHMEDIGHPVSGDKKYGSRTKVIGRLGLHAKVLSFEHPTTGELLRFDTGVPKQFLRPFHTQ